MGLNFVTISLDSFLCEKLIFGPNSGGVLGPLFFFFSYFFFSRFLSFFLLFILSFFLFLFISSFVDFFDVFHFFTFSEEKVSC